MQDDLFSMWQQINNDLFANTLTPPTDIDWGETGGEDGIGAHGVYFPKSRCIAVDERFRFDKGAIKRGSETDELKLEAAYRILIHEAIHQALHQAGDPRSGSHGPTFLAEAQRIAGIMGEPLPTQETVSQWPPLGSLLAGLIFSDPQNSPCGPSGAGTCPTPPRPKQGKGTA